MANVNKTDIAYWLKQISEELGETPSPAGEQVQSDWNQNDNTKVDYIKNKPTIPGVLFVQGDFTGEYESFAPSKGQPSYDEAKAAFKNGTCVMLVVPFESYGGTAAHLYYRVTTLLEGASDDPDGMTFVDVDGHFLCWFDPNWVGPHQPIG